ncbi:MAG: ABC transporter substrate-binding protein, partial [Lachnospiraceae bacterium]|nr:ABC transporter substrate-binding protein [Lachnospiraceae bacterium]
MKKHLIKHRYILLGLLLVLLSAGMAFGGCKKSAGAQVRIGALKGPTTIGLLHLMEEAEAGKTDDDYSFIMAVGADELTPLLAKGELDIALVPANVASILYHKTQGEIRVIDINTLGVLYMVSGSEAIESLADLRGQTVYLTGRGTTPDYVLQYLLAECGIAPEEVTLDYRSEATELAALLADNPAAVELLPQPFVT